MIQGNRNYTDCACAQHVASIRMRDALDVDDTVSRGMCSLPCAKYTLFVVMLCVYVFVNTIMISPSQHVLMRYASSYDV